MKIVYAYNDQGQHTSVTSYNNAGGTNTVNQIRARGNVIVDAQVAITGVDT